MAEQEEKIPTIAKDIVVTKYKMADEIVNRVLKETVDELTGGGGKKDDDADNPKDDMDGASALASAAESSKLEDHLPPQVDDGVATPPNEPAAMDTDELDKLGMFFSQSDGADDNVSGISFLKKLRQKLVKKRNK